MACIALEYAFVPTIILDHKSPDACAILENLQREDLTAPDMALAIKRIIEKGELTQNELAHFLGKSKSWVSKINKLGKLVEDYGGENGVVSFTKLSLSTYLELLDTPELLIMAEDERWNQKRAREIAEKKKSKSEHNSKKNEEYSKDPVDNYLINKSLKKLEKYEPIEISNTGFKINRFKYDKSFGYSTELLLEKIERLQIQLELVITVLRKNLGLDPNSHNMASNEFNLLDQIPFEF
jgi:ParB-like chromosome segregation protein Spo0J